MSAFVKISSKVAFSLLEIAHRADEEAASAWTGSIRADDANVEDDATSVRDSNAVLMMRAKQSHAICIDPLLQKPLHAQEKVVR